MDEIQKRSIQAARDYLDAKQARRRTSWLEVMLETIFGLSLFGLVISLAMLIYGFGL